ncbi:hypothetical protein [Micromonospora sp. NBRC 107095]|uniref:hypothetical protein n=1 Tax=Micromonospora sp. NBRC 107095 TaxID=3032209 RepID=UPI0024A01731|nr:hypothetical protein [Micromonospora sp. NBRC 107095]GLZ62843.1 hypothetical protein Misp05_64190 [Micromonospora sp. NBRC 107095]
MTHLGIAIAGALATRRHKTSYEGKRRTPRNEGPGYLLSPAATQLVTRTPDPVHADANDTTGLLRIRDITPTGAWTRPAGVATDDDISTWVAGGAHIDDHTTGGTCPTCGAAYPRHIPAGEDQRCWTCATADHTGIDDETTEGTEQ